VPGRTETAVTPHRGISTNSSRICSRPIRLPKHRVSLNVRKR
jgi:hypothetical protein